MLVRIVIPEEFQTMDQSRKARWVSFLLSSVIGWGVPITQIFISPNLFATFRCGDKISFKINGCDKSVGVQYGFVGYFQDIPIYRDKRLLDFMLVDVTEEKIIARLIPTEEEMEKEGRLSSM